MRVGLGCSGVQVSVLTEPTYIYYPQPALQHHDLQIS